MTILRSILAVVVTFLGSGALVVALNNLLMTLVPDAFGPGGQVLSTPVAVLMLAYCVAIMVLVGWVAGRIAPSRPALHAGITSGLVVAANIASALGMPALVPLWWLVVFCVLAIPASLYGASRIRRRPRVFT